MQLLEIELVNSPAWVIARSVCAIHTISIHAKSNCSLYKKGGLYKESIGTKNQHFIYFVS